jgi:hypothetical protein
MTVEVTIFSVIALIFVIHTMLSHRLNWALRKANKLDNHKGAVAVVIVAIFLELMFTLLIIKNILL